MSATRSEFALSYFWGRSFVFRLHPAAVILLTEIFLFLHSPKPHCVSMLCPNGTHQEYLTGANDNERPQTSCDRIFV